MGLRGVSVGGKCRFAPRPIDSGQVGAWPALDLLFLELSDNPFSDPSLGRVWTVSTTQFSDTAFLRPSPCGVVAGRGARAKRIDQSHVMAQSETRSFTLKIILNMLRF